MISVLTTVYNGEKFILEAYQALKEQTFKEFEWIIVDDGSYDRTEQVICNDIRKDSEFKVIYSKQNKCGRGKALNVGLSLANYHFIAILDCDDLWHPMKLFIQYKYMHSFNLIGSLSKIFYNTNEIVYDDIDVSRVIYKKLSLRKAIVLNNVCAHSSVIFDKRLFRYNDTLSSQLDIDLIINALIKDESKCIIIYENLCFHRIHDDQNFETKMGKRYLWNSFKLQYKYLNSTSNKIFVPVAFLRFLYLQLPKKARLFIRKLWN